MDSFDPRLEIPDKEFTFNKFFQDLRELPTTPETSDNLNSLDSGICSSDLVPHSSEEWRENFPKAKRNYIIGQIVKSVIPEPDAEALKDRRIKDLVGHARLVEKKFFEIALDREEYYHLVAEKICYFKKEIERRKKIRGKEKEELSNSLGLSISNLSI